MLTTLFSSKFKNDLVFASIMLIHHSLISYPLAIINVFVAGALIHLYRNRVARNWYPPIRATLPVAVFFLLSNIYLVIAPFVPPSDGQSVYESLPYWIHCVVGFGVLAAGGVYWVIWAVILPKIGNYELAQETVIDDIDGWQRTRFVRKPLGSIATTTSSEL